MNRRKKKILSSLLIAGMVMMYSSMNLGTSVVNASYNGGGTNISVMNGVSIDAANFPDDAFREYISKHFDADHDGVLFEDEIKYVNENCQIYLENSDVHDLTGIEFFSGITRIIIYGGQIDNLDLSKNTSLEELTCSGCGLNSINISGCSKLVELQCASNNLTTINLKNNVALSWINLEGNQLTELDLSGNTFLDYLNCSNNSLSALDLSGNRSLGALYCNNNSINSLKLNASVETIDCSDNNLVDLDVDNNSSLIWLNCKNNKITTLNVYNTPLKDAHVYYNEEVNYFDDEYPVVIYCDDSVSINKKSDKSSSQNANGGSTDNSVSPNYSNEWVDGKWYNADGSQTYGPTMTWKSNGSGWWIEDSSGWYPTSTWQKINGQWYYFKADGYMAADEWVNGYWLNSDGSWTYGGVGSWHLGSGGWWYGDTLGYYAYSCWEKIDGNWYFFESTGYIATNKYIDGFWCGADGICH